MRIRLFPALALAVVAQPVGAQLLHFDASRPAPAIVDGYLKMGSGTGPGGTISVNSRYIMRDGRPWIPIMGEFHYSRFPSAYWEEELLKMKASGINTVATYIIWNQHELVPGKLDWTGDRDLRRFAQLCAKHGLLLFVRPGPWVHGETRLGGLPDWVVESTRRRSNDPAYMTQVERFWTGVATQLRGLLWKNGGPTIGVQIENEYNLTGPGQGTEHIAALKRLALKLGLDVPLYTVTGWDNAVYPRGEVAPVVGAYTDEPWHVSTGKLPPRENYVFRFNSRVSGGLGAQTVGDAKRIPDADRDKELTPFLGAEYGPGLPVMYRRRPLVAPDDVAATIVTQIGSGLNLLGYYMYHGGANPMADGRGLEETTRTGGYNDVPRIAYDFQAPLGQYGEVNAVERFLRPLHYFLGAYGQVLANMTLYRPAVVPSGPGDLATPRVAVRSDGARGFVFMNNYVRQYAMAEHRGVQFDVQLPGETLRFPTRPMRVPDKAYFFLPFNMDLDGTRLVWATAQPITRIDGPDGPLHVFKASTDASAEFVFDAAAVIGASAPVRRDNGRLIVDIAPSSSTIVTIRTRQGRTHRLLLLSNDQSRRMWVVEALGARRLVLTDADLHVDGGGLVLRQRGDVRFSFAVWPALDDIDGARATRSGGDIARYGGEAARKSPIRVKITREGDAGSAPPVRLYGPEGSAVQPTPEAFAAAAAWSFTVPGDTLAGVEDAWLTIDYRGDIGRLFDGADMIDDAFWDGRRWRIGLKRFANRLGRTWRLAILPLRGDAPIYFDESVRLQADAKGQIAELNALSIEPEYELRVNLAVR